MFAPGLSSARIPIYFRVLITLGTVMALSPMISGSVLGAIADMPEDRRVLLIFQEIVKGSLIGLMGRFFLLGLQFAANTIWSTIGLAGIPGIPMDELEAGSPLATLASTAAVVVILSLGLHIEMLRAIADSYEVLSLDAPLAPAAMLNNLVMVLSESSLLALRLAAPFIVYGIVVNLALGLANRFAPQVSVYHATTGAVMLGGFFLLYLIWSEWLMLFVSSYSAWLFRGGF